MSGDSTVARPDPPFPGQPQQRPGSTPNMTPSRDYGEHSYRGCAQWTRCTDHWRWFGIGRADVADLTYRRELVNRVTDVFGRLDILVNNAAALATHESVEEITDEEWDHGFRTDVYSRFYPVRAALPHLKPGSDTVNTASITSKSPSPKFFAYAITKEASPLSPPGSPGCSLSRAHGLLALLQARSGPRGFHPPCLLTGFAHFGKNTPLKRPGQPDELASAYVLLSSQRSQAHPSCSARSVERVSWPGLRV
jgi:hypothetical protein